MADVHALVVPYPGQGHINPMMHLAKKLASKGIAVTFVLTNSWQNIVACAHANAGGGDAFAHAQNLGLDIHLACIPDCLPSEFDRASNLSEFFRSIAKMETPVEHLIQTLKQKGVHISCIVADTFLPWAVPLAKRLNLCSISFFTEAVTVFSILYHADLVELEEGSETCIPGVAPLCAADLPLEFLKNRDASPFPEIVALSFQQDREADWVVVNSFEGLEEKVVGALRHQIKVYCVGPLLPAAYLDVSDPRDTVVGTSSRHEISCTQWLDAKPNNSVLYISFGTLLPSFVSVSQVRELAMGFKESGYYFLWVLRPGKEDDLCDVLPPGFLEETEKQGQGLVIPWCSQLEVLSHPSVGGFLSHCGWNSTIESISCGVPILGFPLGGDQFTNCKMIAEEWKVGVRLRSRDQELVGNEEICRNVRIVMEEEKIRKEAQRLRAMAANEVSSRGSSAANLETVVNGLKSKLVGRN